MSFKMFISRLTDIFTDMGAWLYKVTAMLTIMHPCAIDKAFKSGLWILFSGHLMFGILYT